MWNITNFINHLLELLDKDKELKARVCEEIREIHKKPREVDVFNEDMFNAAMRDYAAKQLKCASMLKEPTKADFTFKRVEYDYPTDDAVQGRINSNIFAIACELRDMGQFVEVNEDAETVADKALVDCEQEFNSLVALFNQFKKFGMEYRIFTDWEQLKRAFVFDKTGISVGDMNRSLWKQRVKDYEEKPLEHWIKTRFKWEPDLDKMKVSERMEYHNNKSEKARFVDCIRQCYHDRECVRNAEMKRESELKQARENAKKLEAKKAEILEMFPELAK